MTKPRNILKKKNQICKNLKFVNFVNIIKSIRFTQTVPNKLQNHKNHKGTFDSKTKISLLKKN